MILKIYQKEHMGRVIKESLCALRDFPCPASLVVNGVHDTSLWLS